jgi:prepilin-type N-terminal cleavage/methylation domain-containing protein
MNSSQKGFTLVEMLVAMAVLAFGILSYSLLNMRSLNNRMFSRDLNRATQVAVRAAENLMYLKYDAPLLYDDNGENPAVATKYPGASASNGDTGTFANLDYTVVTKTYTSPQGNSSTDKWYQVKRGKQTYYLRWEVITGNSAVANSPDDKVKLVKIFTAFEKKDPQTGKITLGGYNPDRIGPSIITFITDIET